MGSIFSPKVPAPPPAPPVVSPDNVRDELNNTETVRVQQPDGTYTTIIRALPLSPEEQAAKDQLDQLITDNTSRLTQLVENYDVDMIPGLKDTVQAFRDSNEALLDRAYGRRTEAEERNAARYGVDKGTSATQQRAIRGRDYTDSGIQIGQQAHQLEQDIRQTEIQNTANLLTMATGQQQQNFARQLAGLQLGTGIAQGNAQLAQQRNLAIYNGALQQQGLQFQANQAGMNNLAAMVGLGVGAATGGFGGFGGASAFSSPMKTYAGGALGGGFSVGRGGDIVSWKP